MTTRDDHKDYDVRTLERKLRKGVVNKKDYEKYLKSLPDATDKIDTAPPDKEDDEG